MRTPALAVALLATVLAISIALFGHHPTLSIEQLQKRCEDTDIRYNRARIRACRAILRRDARPEYRGAINTQLCAALAKAGSWKKAVEACILGNDPYPQIANYTNRSVAYDMLGDKQKAAADRVEAKNLGRNQNKNPPNEQTGPSQK